VLEVVIRAAAVRHDRAVLRLVLDDLAVSGHEDVVHMAAREVERDADRHPRHGHRQRRIQSEREILAVVRFLAPVGLGQLREDARPLKQRRPGVGDAPDAKTGAVAALPLIAARSDRRNMD